MCNNSNQDKSGIQEENTIPEAANKEKETGCLITDCTGIIIEKEEIKKYIKCKDFTDPDIFDKGFSKWKYKLRLGNQAYLSTDDTPRRLKPGEFITIKPGDFALLITKEDLDIPSNVMAFISMRFDYKQKGLINVSGFHVDPKYQGKLIFSAFNAGPRDIVLRESDRVFMIFFEKLKGEIEGKGPEGYDYIPAELVEQIRGKSATLASNATRLDKLEFYLKVVGGILITILSLILGVILKKYL